MGRGAPFGFIHCSSRILHDFPFEPFAKASSIKEYPHIPHDSGNLRIFINGPYGGFLQWGVLQNGWFITENP